jgi:hypothetical protein
LKPSLFLIALKHFHTPRLRNKQTELFQTISNIFTSSELFCFDTKTKTKHLLKSLSLWYLCKKIHLILEFNRTKEKLFDLSWIFIIKTKTFQRQQGFLKAKKCFVIFRKCRKWKKTKIFRFDPEFCNKSEYILYFLGRKQLNESFSIMKEFWFDIASDFEKGLQNYCSQNFPLAEI